MTADPFPLHVQNLNVTLGGAAVVRDLTMTAPAGMVTGIIGPNGAGKSSLLRAVLGLVPHQAARLLIGGRDLATLALRERARIIAYLPQGGAVHWPVTVERLVTLGRLPHQEPWAKPNVADARIITAAMTDADILHLKDRPVNRLSGGERMRVLLARMLATEAPVLLADEPVAALDPLHSLSAMSLLGQLAGRGRTVVVVLHDLALAARFCGHLVLMDQGRAAASGPPNDVLAPERLARVYGVRFRGDWTQCGFDFA